MREIPDAWRWFNESRFGMFIHWGPYAEIGRGEQVLMREHIDPREYERNACLWKPCHFNADEWATVASDGGMKYAVLTTRHHDGYCLWDTAFSNYSSAKQAPKRDFVKEYVESFRKKGLRIGLYYSLADFRIPAWFKGPKKDSAGWAKIVEYIFEQVKELLTKYGKIDVLWFDGLWPWTSKEFPSRELMKLIKSLQPQILVNDRLEWPQFSYYWQIAGHSGVKPKDEIGDFGTPEQGIYAKSGYLWESCQTSTWRLWGYIRGARWRPVDEILNILVTCASQGGNFLLNVGPDGNGKIPPEFVQISSEIGDWLKIHGEAIYGSEGGNITEFVTRGTQILKGNNIYLIIKFWDGRPVMRLADLITPVKKVTLLTTGQVLSFRQKGEELFIEGLPQKQPCKLFPVIKVECCDKPQGGLWARERLWGGNPLRYAEWASCRGESVDAFTS